MSFTCPLRQSPDLELISFNEALELTDHKHAAHCCIYSPCSTPAISGCVSSALILMQMRFDGRLGFHGGLVKQPDILGGLNRELKEEVNLNEKLFATDKDYLFTHRNISTKQCLHFYAKEVTQKDFEEIERGVFDACDFGKETLGLIRVPMYTMRDDYCGLPAFLKNCFVADARNQLLNFLLLSKLMSSDEIDIALKNSEKDIF